MEADWNSGIVSAVYALVGSLYLAKALAFAGNAAVYTQAKALNDFNFGLL